MADSQPIKSTDVVEKDLFKNLTASGKEALKVVDELTLGLTKTRDAQEEILKQSKNNVKSAADIKKVSDALDKSRKSIEGLSAVEKERLKLKKRLKEANSDSIQANEELKVQLSEQRKVNKQLAKEKLGLISTYEKESKRLNELRKEYKNLVLNEGKAAKGAKELREEIVALDTELKDLDADVGQFQRNVGNYGESMSEAAETTAAAGKSIAETVDKSGALGDVFNKLQVATSILSAAKDKLSKSTDVSTVSTETNSKATKKAGFIQRVFAKTLKGSRRGVLLLNKALKAGAIGLAIVALGSLASFLTRTQAGLVKLKAVSLASGAVISELADRLIKLGPALLSLGKLMLIIPRTLINVINTAIDGFSLLRLEIKNAFSFSEDAKRETEAAQKAFEESGASLKKVFTDIPDDISTAFNGIKDGLTGVGDSISQIVKNAEPVAQQLTDIELANARIGKTLEERLAVSEKLEEIEGDATRSFKEREEAILGSIAAQKEAADLAVQIAENNLRAFEIETKFNNQSLEETNEIKIARIEAEKEVLAAKKDANIKSLQLTKVQNQLEQDLLERDLDILLDGFDNQKSINERKISDEKRVFKERQKILDETNQLGEESFEKQIETIQKLTDEQIDANDLLAESDAIALNEKIRGLELSEIIEGRLLEVIRDRRTAVQDLTDAQIELNQARLDSLRAISESEQNIDQENLSLSVELLQKRLEAEKITAEEIEEINTAIYDVKKEAIIDQADFEKEQAKKDIVEADELAAKLKEIENKKNNDIIRLNQERNDVVNAANKKAAEERIEFLKDIANQTLSELEIELDKANQAKKDANNEDIKETQDNIARQQNLAEKGLDNQLAFEQKKLADAEIEKREIEKREQRQKEALQLAEAYLELRGIHC